MLVATGRRRRWRSRSTPPSTRSRSRPIRKRIEIAAADTFIVEWFGDLPVLLDDQSQAAADPDAPARARRLAPRAALRRHRPPRPLGRHDRQLRDASSATATTELPVAKLITLGEAIKLGWRLEQDVGDWFPGNSVRGDLKANHPTLRWVDIWASYDPAPSGEMAEADGSPLLPVEKLSQTPPKTGADRGREPARHELHAPRPRTTAATGRTTRAS